MVHNIFAFTGHRPEKIGGYGPGARNDLAKFAKDMIKDLKPGHCISGMALGWDTAVAVACTELDIPWTAAVPFPQQPNVWNPEDRQIWQYLITQASKVEYVSDSFSVRNLQKRNEWMVDRCDYVVAMWDGTTGGTKNCIDYANRMKKPVVNWWDDYMRTKSPLNSLFS